MDQTKAGRRGRRWILRVVLLTLIAIVITLGWREGARLWALEPAGVPPRQVESEPAARVQDALKAFLPRSIPDAAVDLILSARFAPELHPEGRPLVQDEELADAAEALRRLEPQLVALRDLRKQLSEPEVRDVNQLTHQRVTRLLLASARVLTLESRSQEAWDSILTAIWLTRDASDGRMELGFLREIGHAAAGFAVLADLNADQLGLVAADLRDRAPWSALRHLNRVWLERELVERVNRCYSLNADGNGELVLSAATPAWRVAAQSRSRAWNLFAPLYNDRKTVLARCQLASRMDHPVSFDALDGPLLESMGNYALMNAATHERRIQGAEASWSAARCLIALRQFRVARARDAADLHELVPEFLDAVPQASGVPLQLQVDDGPTRINAHIGGVWQVRSSTVK